MTVQKNIETSARGIKAGDLLDGKAVDSATPGTKKMAVYFEGRKSPMYIDLDAGVTVTREVETDEEKAAKKHLQTMQMTEWVIQRLEASDPRKTARVFAEKENPALDYGFLTDLLSKAADRKVADATNYIMSIGKVENLLMAFAVAYVNNTKKRDWNDPLSRSTSVTSNLIEDVELAAWDRTLSELGRPAREAVAKVMLDREG